MLSIDGEKGQGGLGIANPFGRFFWGKVERFRIETAPASVATEGAVGSWQRAALVEGVSAKEAVQNHLEGGAKWLS